MFIAKESRSFFLTAKSHFKHAAKDAHNPI